MLVPLLVTVFVRHGLIAAESHPPAGTQADIGLTVVYYLIGVIVIYIPTIAFIVSLLPCMFRIDSLAKPPGRSEIIMFVRDAVQTILRQTAGVLGQTGHAMSREAADEFTKRCFTQANGVYSGVESHLPSEFFDRYPGFLDAHALNLSKNPGSNSFRILLATRVALREDYQRPDSRYEEFFNWHDRRRGVKLLHVPPRLASKLATELRLPTTDVGVWKDQYALLFSPEEGDTSVTLTMIPRGSPSFDRCVSYLEKLLASAAEVTNPPQLVDEATAQNWQAYVGPKGRHEGRTNERGMYEPGLQAILLQHLNDCRGEDSAILDAAAGIGCESVLLQENGFSVISNEIEPHFRQQAIKYAFDHGRNLGELHAYDWLDLTKHFQMKLAAVLVLGNSLCLIADPANRRAAVRQFYDVLRRGGTLIIDERNFPHMIEHASEILDNPPAKFQFGRSMYRGTTVKGCPIDITERKIVWACYTNGSRVTDFETLTRNIIAEFELFPFKKDELRRMLEDAGFEIVATYYDLASTPAADAEFITYVARKPS